MDEGVIYEDGPPEAIFEHPKREKTRAFIRRIRRWQFQISDADYDLYALNAEVELFCEKHILPRRMREHVISLVEEVLALQPSYDDVQLTLDYSERDGTLQFICSSAGAPGNILEAGGRADDLSERLIRGRTERADYRYDNGRNILTLKVRNDKAD
jgi:polar amino acid transport system ATP-binding protein